MPKSLDGRQTNSPCLLQCQWAPSLLPPLSTTWTVSRCGHWGKSCEGETIHQPPNTWPPFIYSSPRMECHRHHEFLGSCSILLNRTFRETLARSAFLYKRQCPAIPKRAVNSWKSESSLLPSSTLEFKHEWSFWMWVSVSRLPPSCHAPKCNLSAFAWSGDSFRGSHPASPFSSSFLCRKVS